MLFDKLQELGSLLFGLDVAELLSKSLSFGFGQVVWFEMSVGDVFNIALLAVLLAGLLAFLKKAAKKLLFWDRW